MVVSEVVASSQVAYGWMGGGKELKLNGAELPVCQAGRGESIETQVRLKLSYTSSGAQLRKIGIGRGGFEVAM